MDEASTGRSGDKGTEDAGGQAGRSCDTLGGTTLQVVLVSVQRTFHTSGMPSSLAHHASPFCSERDTHGSPVLPLWAVSEVVTQPRKYLITKKSLSLSHSHKKILNTDQTKIGYNINEV